jgi:aminocarboxymuconate-semialdehyde decarboxylase
MAELVRSHPDRFLGFAAGLLLNDVDASVAELERVVVELGALGVHLYAPVSGRPLDEPGFEPLFEMLAGLGVAIWLHPTRGKAEKVDYQTEDASQFGIWFALGWPWESSVAMARLVFSGLVSCYPGLPIITHHGGGFVLHFPDRLVALWEELDAFSPVPSEHRIPQLQSF